MTSTRPPIDFALLRRFAGGIPIKCEPEQRKYPRSGITWTLQSFDGKSVQITSARYTSPIPDFPCNLWSKVTT